LGVQTEAGHDVRELTQAERTFIERMPKAELHVHLEGSVQPETLLTLARKHAVRLPIADVAGAREWFRFRDFPHFIEIYVSICEVLLDEEDFEQVVWEQALACARQNIRYQEITFAPASPLKPRSRALPDVVLAGMRAGRRRALDELGVELQFVLDPVRIRDVEEVWVFARWFADNLGDGLVGFGLGGTEVGNPASRYADIFRWARDAGGRLTLHAGETVGPESVRDALAVGAERIGHGVRAIEDPALVAELAARNVVLEVSPTSNVCLGVYPDYAAHPLRRLDAAGVPVTLNSDDPPMFATTLTNEYIVAAEQLGYSLDELAGLSLRAVEAAFLPETERAALARSFRQELATLQATLAAALP
jgi:aminodeoxyfutalosine deaminase